MISIANIQTALVEILTGVIGTTRTVTASTIERGVTDDEALRALSLAKTQCNVTFGLIENNDANPFHVRSNYRLVNVPITVELVQHLPSVIEIANRDTIRAGLIYLADQALQALSYPNNMLVTSAAAATGIIGGCLQDTKITAFVENWDNQIITTTITGTAIVRVDQSV